MSPTDDTVKGEKSDVQDHRKRLDWDALRKVVCEQYFRGRGVEQCPDCHDRAVCFQMIDDALDLVEDLRAKKAKQKLSTQQGIT